MISMVIKLIIHIWDGKRGSRGISHNINKCIYNVRVPITYIRGGYRDGGFGYMCRRD